MQPKEIKQLIELVSRSNFSTFEMEREGFRIKLIKGEVVVAPAPVRAAPAAIPASGGAAAPAPTTAPADEPAVDDGLVPLNSPIVGTCYMAPSPEAPDFVSVGARVAKGQTLCIVEAMKVMNEIESEIDAEVAEIRVKNGQPVEFGEVLFLLRPL